MDSLGIAIDSGRYVRIDSGMGDLPRTVRLRTLSAGQDSALLEFCRFHRDGPRILKSHRVSGLVKGNADATELKLRIERRTFALWEITISRSGVMPETLRIRTRIGLWPLFIPVIAVLCGFIWFLLSGLSAAPSAVAGYQAPSTATVSVQTEKTSDTTQVPDADPAPEAESEPEPDTTEVTPAPEPVSEPEPDAQVEAIAILPPPITLYFSPDSAILDSSGRRILDDLVSLLPEMAVLSIEGHCAEYGTERGQKALSLLRARNVAEYLRPGLPAGVILELNGFGIEDPATRDPERQDLNRRVVVNPQERR